MKTLDARYLLKVASPVQPYRMGGAIGEHPISDKNIIEGSLVYTDQATGAELSLGGVYIGTLEATITGVNIPRGKWRGTKVQTYIELDTGEGWQRIPMKPYTITKAEHTADGVYIEASDAMAKFNKTATFDTLTGSAYEILATCCTRCGVQMGLSEMQVAQLPNGTEELGLYPENDIETYRDVISWVAQTLGSFATIDVNGRLSLRQFTGAVSGSKEPDIRYEGASFSDFETFYTGMSVVDIEAQETKYYNKAPDNGLTMNLGSNPFLQYGTDETVENMRRAILEEIAKIKLTPFELETVPDPNIELGDVLRFPGGLGADAVGCVMYSELHYKEGLRIIGYGEDPALANGKSKTDKELAGLSRGNDAKGIIYHEWTNVRDVGLTETLEKIAGLRVVTRETADIVILHEFKIITSRPTEITLNYYLDGVLIDYAPVQTWGEAGPHILGTYYHAKLDGGEAHDWEVRISGDGVIHAGDARITLSGQGLALSKEWDGLVELSDVGAFPLETPAFEINLAGAPRITTQTPQKTSISETIAVPLERGGLIIALNEELTVIASENSYQFVTENDIPIITEEGDTLYTEGG